jgi:hypothetical protein
MNHAPDLMTLSLRVLVLGLVMGSIAQLLPAPDLAGTYVDGARTPEVRHEARDRHGPAEAYRRPVEVDRNGRAHEWAAALSSL